MVEIDEAVGDGDDGQGQGCVGVGRGVLDTEVGQGVEQGELVGRGELAFGEDALDLFEELDLGLGGLALGERINSR